MTADDAPLRVEHAADGIAFSGEIDAHAARLVRSTLLPLADSGALRVDLSGVTFIDSSGLRVVLEVHQALERAGRHLVLVAPSRPVARLIQVAGLSSHLHLDPSIDPESDARIDHLGVPVVEPANDQPADPATGISSPRTPIADSVS
jgi:anti-anti-sigma factor